MKSIEYDLSQTGLRAVVKDWQEKLLRVVWVNSDRVNSRMAYEKVNEALVRESESISRASVINFLEDMREMCALRGEERTGKGGHHMVYFAAIDEAGFKRYIAEQLIGNLLKNSKETQSAINSSSL
jgi:hypothetical protein